MNLKNKKLTIDILLIAILIVAFGVLAFRSDAGLKDGGVAAVNQGFSLVPPVFAASMTPLTTFLNNEAGIALWLNVTAPLNLNDARRAMVNIENSTSDYVIGSLSDNGGIASSNDYPHCFVTKTGWIVVYYLKANTQNPGTTGWLGKIIDWQLYSNKVLSGNFLTEGMEYVASTLGLSSTNNKQYYHFQYPSATTLLIAIKHADGGNTATFNIQIPGEIATIYERSWSCSTSYSDTVTFKIDTNTIFTTYGVGRYYGSSITNSMLSRDTPHTVSITSSYTYGSGAYVCLLLLY